MGLLGILRGSLACLDAEWILHNSRRDWLWRGTQRHLSVLYKSSYRKNAKARIEKLVFNKIDTIVF